MAPFYHRAEASSRLKCVFLTQRCPQNWLHDKIASLTLLPKNRPFGAWQASRLVKGALLGVYQECGAGVGTFCRSRSRNRSRCSILSWAGAGAVKIGRLRLQNKYIIIENKNRSFDLTWPIYSYVEAQKLLERASDGLNAPHQKFESCLEHTGTKSRNRSGSRQLLPGAGAGAALSFYSEPELEPKCLLWAGAGAGAGVDSDVHGSASLFVPHWRIPTPQYATARLPALIWQAEVRPDKGHARSPGWARGQWPEWIGAVRCSADAVRVHRLGRCRRNNFMKMCNSLHREEEANIFGCLLMYVAII